MMAIQGLEHPAVLCGLGVIQLLGLISAFATRLGGVSYRATAVRWVFVICLGVVALSTALTVGGSSCSWLTSGTTFSLMVLTAIWDFGGGGANVVW